MHDISDDKKMNICLIITGLGVGGAETQVTSLADAFSEKGHSVLLLVLTGEAIIHPKDSRVRTILLRSQKSPISLTKCYFRARQLIKLFKPDVVHSHMVHANIFARLLRLTTPMPKLVCTAHSTNEGGILCTLSYRLTDWLADVSTNVSDEAVACYVKKKAVRSGRMVTIYNGVDTDKFIFSPSSRIRMRKELNIANNVKVFLAVGRLSPAKDYPNLLKAFSKVMNRDALSMLLIAGMGPLENSLKLYAKELGEEKNVRFLGVRNDVSSLMSLADIFVLSSKYEGFGLVVAEAMACERVVVATNCGGVAEVLGTEGILVPTSDADELASGMVTATGFNSDEYREKGIHARNRIIEKYSLNAMVLQWLKIYGT